MKTRFCLIVAMALILSVLAGVFVSAQNAPALMTFDSPLPPPGPVLPPVDLGEIEGWMATIGVGALALLLAELLKRLGVLPDGSAGLFATVCNVVAFAGLMVAGVFGFDVTGSSAQSVIEILTAIGQLALMVISSPITFKLLRDANVLKPLPSRA